MNDEIKPLCTGCNKRPGQIPEFADIAKDEGMEPDQYVREEEGTYNPASGHFLCTHCYIVAGMPSLPYPKRWICP